MRFRFKGNHGPECCNIAKGRADYLAVKTVNGAYEEYYRKYMISIPGLFWKELMAGKVASYSDFQSIFADPDFHGNYHDFGIFIPMSEA